MKAKSAIETVQLIIMTVAFAYHFVTEETANLQEPPPEDGQEVTVPATARVSLKSIANMLTDMTEGLEADKFGGWKGEHEEQREAVRLMTAVHNKNNRLSSGDQDVTVAEYAMAHIMNLHGVKDLQGNPIHKDDGQLRARCD